MKVVITFSLHPYLIKEVSTFLSQTKHEHAYGCYCDDDGAYECEYALKYLYVLHFHY